MEMFTKDNFKMGIGKERGNIFGQILVILMENGWLIK
jgi:hypothetical protein